MTTRNTSSSDGFSEDKCYPREENSNTSQSFATVINFGYFAFIFLLSSCNSVRPMKVLSPCGKALIHRRNGCECYYSPCGKSDDLS